MKDHDPTRRHFLQLLPSVPAGFLIGFASEQEKPLAQTPDLSPEESLKKLIRLLGPWSVSDREKADGFAERFLKASSAVEPYLPGSSELVQSLADRFGDGPLKEIDLRNLPAKEQALLVQLAQQLYSYVEVRFYTGNKPPWGQCQGDATQYTRAPV